MSLAEEKFYAKEVLEDFFGYSSDEFFSVIEMCVRQRTQAAVDNLVQAKGDAAAGAVHRMQSATDRQLKWLKRYLDSSTFAMPAGVLSYLDMPRLDTHEAVPLERVEAAIARYKEVRGRLLAAQREAARLEEERLFLEYKSKKK